MAEDEFPEKHWDEMRAAMESRGAAAVAEFIGRSEDPGDRLKLYQFAQQAFASRDWKGKSLDAQIELIEAGVAEAISQSKRTTDPEIAAKRKDAANVFAYNLSADLAECWPGDETPRERRHFEAGLKAAADCIRWREELNKGAFPFSIAYWAKGAHETSLGRFDDAVASLAKSVEFGKKAAVENDKRPTIDADGGFIPIVDYGYLGIAKIARGDSDGRTLLEEVLAAFEAMKEKHADMRDDAQFGIDQLLWFEAKIAARFGGGR